MVLKLEKHYEKGKIMKRLAVLLSFLLILVGCSGKPDTPLKNSLQPKNNQSEPTISRKKLGNMKIIFPAQNTVDEKENLNNFYNLDNMEHKTSGSAHSAIYDDTIYFTDNHNSYKYKIGDSKAQKFGYGAYHDYNAYDGDIYISVTEGIAENAETYIYKLDQYGNAVETNFETIKDKFLPPFVICNGYLYFINKSDTGNYLMREDLKSNSIEQITDENTAWFSVNTDYIYFAPENKSADNSESRSQINRISIDTLNAPAVNNEQNKNKAMESVSISKPETGFIYENTVYCVPIYEKNNIYKYNFGNENSLNPAISLSSQIKAIRPFKNFLYILTENKSLYRIDFSMISDSLDTAYSNKDLEKILDNVENFFVHSEKILVLTKSENESYANDYFLLDSNCNIEKIPMP